jgi:hypothetical protein
VSSAAPGRDGTVHTTHVFSVFGPWCYLCGARRRWWKFWQNWTEEDHDEPF